VRDVTLAIETSNPSGVAPGATARPGVALLRGGTPLAVEAIATANAQHDDLMSAIDRACAAAGVTPRDVARIAVSIGPGGFTNVRIAVTCARMIAEVTGATLIGVPTALVVAAGTQHSGTAAIALASKGDTAHVTMVEQGRIVGEARIMDAAALTSQPVACVIADSLARSNNWPVVAPTFDPLACARASVGLEAVDPARLSPIYPREPEAVTKWRAMHAAKK
jgi:tRNA threonylcarbamoyladenosine biosynthesis protein TsaB